MQCNDSSLFVNTAPAMMHDTCVYPIILTDQLLIFITCRGDVTHKLHPLQLIKSSLLAESLCSIFFGDVRFVELAVCVVLGDSWGVRFVRRAACACTCWGRE